MGLARNIGNAGNGLDLYYVEADALGTPRVVIDPIRNVAVWRWDLTGEAFGEDSPNEDPDGDNTAFVLDMRYPGQQYDSATGFNYNYFRDYDPSTGRYGQSDPIGLKGGINTYGYVRENPMTRVDFFGLKDFTACETRAELDKVFMQLNVVPQLPLNTARFATVAWNHTGKFDYKYRQKGDTFIVSGVQYSSAEFGNFAAGYMSAWFDNLGIGYWFTRRAGVVFDYLDGNGDGDLDSIEDINAGYEMGNHERASGQFNSCGCIAGGSL